MTRHYQRGDAGVAMLVVMVAMMIGFFWRGGDRGSHMVSRVPAGAVETSSSDLPDESHVRDEVSPAEYLPSGGLSSISSDE